MVSDDVRLPACRAAGLRAQCTFTGHPSARQNTVARWYCGHCWTPRGEIGRVKTSSQNGCVNHTSKARYTLPLYRYCRTRLTLFELITGAVCLLFLHSHASRGPRGLRLGFQRQTSDRWNWHGWLHGSCRRGIKARPLYVAQRANGEGHIGAPITEFPAMLIRMKARPCGGGRRQVGGPLSKGVDNAIRCFSELRGKGHMLLSIWLTFLV